MESKGKQQLHHQHQSTSFHQPVFMANNKGGGTATATAAATGGYDLGELDQALFMYLEGHDQTTPLHAQRQTLEIFPSRPMNADPSNKEELGIRRSDPSNSNGGVQPVKNGKVTPIKREREITKKGASSTSGREGTKSQDPKTLRRLAQNREAARKSRLRKKAYVQQLESSRIRLAQVEQELQKAKNQGIFYGLSDQSLLTAGVTCSMSSEAAVFEMEYGRWVEEHHRMVCELKAALQQQQQAGAGAEESRELRVLVDGCLSHYDAMFITVKSAAIKGDVFHLMSAAWVSPAERCFFWLAGFRPSHIIKIMLSHIEAATEHQLLEIYALQQSARETEDALSQGLDALQTSLSDLIASDELDSPSNMANYMAQMAIAVSKLSALEDFVRQADSLRHQTLHRLHQLLTARQAARFYIAIAEYFHRLRALSSLWLTRPRQDQ